MESSGIGQILKKCGTFLWLTEILGGPDNVYDRPLPGGFMDTQKLLIVNSLFGWEAGIRTPITWSRER
jgi:hypothetical protein